MLRDLRIPKHIIEVERDIQRTVLVHVDPIDQLRQVRAGESVDVVVLFEIFDKCVCLIRGSRISNSCFEVLDTRNKCHSDRDRLRYSLLCIACHSSSACAFAFI